MLSLAEVRVKSPDSGSESNVKDLQITHMFRYVHLDSNSLSMDSYISNQLTTGEVNHLAPTAVFVGSGEQVVTTANPSPPSYRGQRRTCNPSIPEEADAAAVRCNVMSEATFPSVEASTPAKCGEFTTNIYIYTYSSLSH